mmetsp:Transcript_23279/g.27395  ORF Transcript_23279/g.27395 Transcript_23279/m.27395 type:complete len:81 (-) Transcript_23279:5849-6091(-)
MCVSPLERYCLRGQVSGAIYSNRNEEQAQFSQRWHGQCNKIHQTNEPTWCRSRIPYVAPSNGGGGTRKATMLICGDSHGG